MLSAAMAAIGLMGAVVMAATDPGLMKQTEEAVHTATFGVRIDGFAPKPDHSLF